MRQHKNKLETTIDTIRRTWKPGDIFTVRQLTLVAPINELEGTWPGSTSSRMPDIAARGHVRKTGRKRGEYEVLPEPVINLDARELTDETNSIRAAQADARERLDRIEAKVIRIEAKLDDLLAEWRGQ